MSRIPMVYFTIALSVQKKECQTLEAKSGHPCRAKVEKSTHSKPAPTYTRMKKDYRSNNHVPLNFWFCADDINRCMKGSKKKRVFDWPNIPRVWPVKVGTNLIREEVFALEDVGFPLQQKEALSPRRRLRTMTNLPIPRSHFCVPPNPYAHPNTQFSKVVRRNMATPLLKHRNIRESALHMDGYYVVGVIPVPYSGYKCIITIVSKVEKTYFASIADIPQCTCPNFAKMLSLAVGKRGQWVSCKHLLCVQVFVQG